MLLATPVEISLKTQHMTLRQDRHVASEICHNGCVSDHFKISVYPERIQRILERHCAKEIQFVSQLLCRAAPGGSDQQAKMALNEVILWFILSHVPR